MKASVRHLNFVPAGFVGFTVPFLAVLVLLLPTPAHAQSSTASISGTVRDSSGSIIPGADVLLTNTQTNVERRAVTNGAGVEFPRHGRTGHDDRDHYRNAPPRRGDLYDADTGNARILGMNAR